MQAMSNHPYSTSKLLPTFSSSASSTSSDHHKLSRGSCTGLLFQLFDWNSRLQKKHLFGHKSLPAERPARLIPKDLFCGSEKLPSAQMLNTPDEGHVPRDLEAQPEDALQKDQTPEKKKKKRSPNVVAKLMGLETMPSPDLRREKWPSPYQRSMPIKTSDRNSFVSNSRIPSSRRSLMDIENGALSNSSSRRGFGVETLSQDSSHVRQDEARCQDMTHKDKASKVSTMVASQSPADAKNGAFGCILLSSNTHNKMSLPVKSALAPKSTMCMLEAGNRVLEHNRQSRTAHIRSVESRQMLATGSNENEKENDKKATQRKSNSSKQPCSSSCLYPDNSAPHCASRKITDAAAASRPHAANNRQSSSSSATNVNIKEDAVVRQLKQGQGADEDKSSAKCHSSQQGVESSMEKKRKPCVKRQENTRRRLNEANDIKLQSTKPAIVKLERDIGPSKIIIRHHRESYETASTSSTLSTITQNKSVSSSNNISKHKRLFSSDKAKGDKESKMKSDEGEPAIKSMYTRGAGTVGCERPISRGRIRISQCKTMGNKVSSESRQEDSSNKSCISKDLNQESGSINQDISRCDDVFLVDQLNEDFCRSIQNFDDVSDPSASSQSAHEGDKPEIEEIRENLAFLTSAEITRTDFDTRIISSDIDIAQNTCPSSCVSSIDEMRDTASSCDINSTHRKKQTVSYSGKSTATILHELLSALNSSAKLSILENEPIQGDPEVSGVTSTTIKTTGNPLNASSACIGENDSNSLARSISSSKICLQNSVEGPEWLSNKEDLLLRGCKDKCWQSSPTSSLVSPFHNQTCISLEKMEYAKEEHDCWHKWSKCMRNPTDENDDEFTYGGQSSNDKDASQVTENTIQSEEDYVDIVVKAAKLSPDDIFSTKLQATNSLLDPAIFDKLEEMHTHNWECRARSKTEADDLYTTNAELVYHHEDVARDYRKLMFDCVQEALSLDLGISEHSLQLDYPPHLRLPWQACCRRVLKHIHDWKGVRCGMNVDDMVENAMNTGAGKWVDFSSEFFEVAGEVGASIYNDLVDELVLDLQSSCRMSIDARSAKTTRLGRMEKKRLIWVGL